MEPMLDLDAFSRVLSDKGYSGYFTTQAAYPGKLKDSLTAYLKGCAEGTEPIKDELLLRGYLQWSGDDKPRVECLMAVKHEKGRFELQKMDIVRKDRFGQTLKNCPLMELSVQSAPKAAEAVRLVMENQMQKTIQSPCASRFKNRRL